MQELEVVRSDRWEEEIMKELEVNLRLRRNFDKVSAAFISPFFNLVPADYANENPEMLLTFSESGFENNTLLTSDTGLGAVLVFGTSQPLVEKLKDRFPEISLYHSGSILLDQVGKSEGEMVMLNLIKKNLELAIFRDSKLIFYNLFDTPSGEDILFFTLFALEQTGVNNNEAKVKCYGELRPETRVFHILKKYIRHLDVPLKNTEDALNFTLYTLSKCELSQAH